MARRASSPKIDQHGLWLGWTQHRPAGVGFQPPRRRPERRPVVYRGDAHALTVGMTGCGKFVSSVGTSLGTYAGSTITIDLKGEAYTVWSDWRRKLGQRVILIDPFREFPDAPRDSLNPLDVLNLNGVFPDVECEALAALFADGQHSSNDPYWAKTSQGLIGGLLDYIRTLPDGQRNLTTLRRMLLADDLDLDVAVLLDNQKVAPGSLARDEFVAYLTAPSDKTRPCIRSTAQSFVKCLGSQGVAQVLERSSFGLQLLLDDEPFSLFLVFPARYLESHRSVLRLLLHVILTTIGRRRQIPAQRTLLLCDETAQLGTLPALRQAITLLRGSGLLCHSYWQDLSQIRQLYPLDYETIINNCGVLQVLSVANHQMAESCSHVLGLSARELTSMEPDQQALFIRGEGAFIAKKLNYLRDPEFAGRFALNPRYALHPYGRNTTPRRLSASADP